MNSLSLSNIIYVDGGFHLKFDGKWQRMQLIQAFMLPLWIQCHAPTGYYYLEGTVAAVFDSEWNTGGYIEERKLLERCYQSNDAK